MAFHPSPADPPRDRDARAFMPDADACVDELMALAEWLRDHRARRESAEPGRDAAA
jgi:hypothetical protein